MAVLVSKNGSTDAETVLLEQKNGTFEGVYENVDQAGTYLLETQIREGDTVITSNTATISVLQLPSVKSDTALKDEIFKLSENQFVTGYLELDGDPLAGIPDLSITSFSLIENYEDGHQDIHTLLDGESDNSGDAVNGDGIYSLPLSFDEEGTFTANLVVQGTYQGANFTLEKELGSYQVISGGLISGTFSDAEIVSKPGGEVTIPVKIENQSGRSETVHVSVAADQDISEEQVLTLKAGEQIETTFLVKLANDAPLEKQNVTLELVAEDPLTGVETGKSTSIDVISANALFMRNMRNFLAANSILIATLSLLPVFDLSDRKASVCHKDE